MKINFARRVLSKKNYVGLLKGLLNAGFRIRFDYVNDNHYVLLRRD